MNFSKNTSIVRGALILFSFFVVTSILWNTYVFFQKFKEEERVKMEIFTEANREIFKNPLDDKNITTLLKIIESNKTIPIIITTENDKEIWGHKNLDSVKALDTVYLRKQLKIMKEANTPITFFYKDPVDGKKIVQNVYYRDSDLLTKLKYYPLALLFILTLFGLVIYFAFKSTRSAEQNKLWAGMAKETAHQIGTPLSSLLGWIEILRMENVDKSIVYEIEKDVSRLNTIAERFSKIGSIPKLEKMELIGEVEKTFNYIKSRSSKQVNFLFNTDLDKLYVSGNKQLLGWVIENLIKNAIDAMQGKGTLKVSVTRDNTNAKILICDSGKGLQKKQFKQIFETGYTTKKRGWGLGLSLAKRIIEDYHHGKIFVKSSILNQGTCMEIDLLFIKKNKN